MGQRPRGADEGARVGAPVTRMRETVRPTKRDANPRKYTHGMYPLAEGRVGRWGGWHASGPCGSSASILVDGGIRLLVPSLPAQCTGSMAEDNPHPRRCHPSNYGTVVV